MTSRAITVALLATLIAACAAPPRPRPASYPPRAPTPVEPVPDAGEPPYSYREDIDYPRSAEAISGPAVLVLLERAQGALQIGQFGQAVATLETALDIEPRNPFVWQRMAETHLRQRLPEQAENKAHRSNSFAHGNPYVEQRNWRLIAEARAARGDHAGAQAARARADAIEAALAE